MQPANPTVTPVPAPAEPVDSPLIPVPQPANPTLTPVPAPAEPVDSPLTPVPQPANPTLDPGPTTAPEGAGPSLSGGGDPSTPLVQSPPGDATSDPADGPLAAGSVDDGAGPGSRDGAAEDTEPALEQCLTGTSELPEGCEDLAIAGLTGPDAWRGTGPTDEQRSGPTDFFADGPAAGAPAQQATAAQAAGPQAFPVVWSELGTGELLLVTLVPPLALLTVGYLALGRRYP